VFGVKGIGVGVVVSRSISNQYPIRKKKGKKSDYIFLFFIKYTFKGIFFAKYLVFEKKKILFQSFHHNLFSYVTFF